ncbi:hypothetical protein T12_5195 [Trichinella patagoniensis]|uniref:Uncharacterized protein n=1 Tax=Trichinella patagoniensis TaxID=990121 RepID=A0A0V1ABE7_9BILA|nr:hypothetical protein T12_5195 [Trichinella patagoniensis]
MINLPISHVPIFAAVACRFDCPHSQQYAFVEVRHLHNFVSQTSSSEGLGIKKRFIPSTAYGFLHAPSNLKLVFFTLSTHTNSRSDSFHLYV